MSQDHAADHSHRFSPLMGCVVVALVAGVGLAVWLTRGALADPWPSQFVPLLFVLAFNAIPVSGWLIAAWGYGALVRRALRLPTAELGSVDLGLGIAALLWLDHALGAAGVLQMGGSAGAWVLLCVGWLTAMMSLRERIAARTMTLKIGGWSGWALIAALPAVVVLIVASTSAPGWLWASEANGYDVLEYHLQMPSEWLRLGLLTPLTHNAYSFAPSYVEAAYYHIAALLDGLATRPLNGAVTGATACQLLHACLMIWAAREVTLLTRRFVSHWFALAAGAMAISVPWVVVTGSMAYDEAVLIGLLALCWRLVDARPIAWRSFVLIGFLTGVSCGAKLTAVGGVVLPIGMLLLVRLERRQWWWMIVGCCAGGLIALGPYLIRNYVALYGANPLFPFLANTLGSAHWTSEQVARWNNEHGPHGDWAFRLKSLWAMAFLHAQWAGLWFVTLLAIPLAWSNETKRRAFDDAWIVLGLQLVFWLELTHGQSRFLLPCVPPMVVFIVLGLEELAQRWRRVAIGLSVALPLALSAWCVHLYGREHDGHPAAYIDGLRWRTGVDAPPLDRANAQALAEANSDVFLNLFVPADKVVYLLGDATPFYILRPVVWHTTWDTSPLGQIIRAHGDDQDAWTRALLAEGIDLVMVNYSELKRLVQTDRNYDPIFAGVDVRGYFESHAKIIARWDSRVLYQLVEPSK